MDRNSQLDARRLNIIRQITEIENEDMLGNIEEYIARNRKNLHESARNYPYAPSKEELHSIIEQVLEDDRNGLFVDGEEHHRKMRLMIEELTKKQNNAI